MNKRKQTREKHFKTLILSISTEQTSNPQHRNHIDNLHSIRPHLHEAFAAYMETKRTEDYHLACNTTYGNTASTNSCNTFEIIPQCPRQVLHVQHTAIRLCVPGFFSTWCMVRYTPNLQLVESNCKTSSIQNSRLASKDIKMG